MAAKLCATRTVCRCGADEGGVAADGDEPGSERLWIREGQVGVRGRENEHILHQIFGEAEIGVR